MAKFYYEPNLVSGRTDHYHHFLAGYLLPVIADADLTKGDEISLAFSGPMTRLIHEVGFTSQPNFKTEVEPQIFGPPPEGYEVRNVRGVDGCNTAVPDGFAKNVNAKLDHIFGIEESEYADCEPEILLIDRGEAPKEIFDENEHIRLSGSQRRTLSNMDEIAACLEKYGPVNRCFLDDKSFREQIIAFRRAKFVVAQHGAGLSNLVFAKQCKHVLEFAPEEKIGEQVWFKNLSKHVGAVHRVYLINQPFGKLNIVWNIDIELLDAKVKHLLTL